MNKVLLTFTLLVCLLKTNAQTSMKRTPDSKKVLWCAYGSAAVAVTFRGLYEVQTKAQRKNSYLDLVGNSALFLTGALLVTSLNQYGSERRKEKGLSLQVAPTAFSLAYRF